MNDDFFMTLMKYGIILRHDNSYNGIRFAFRLFSKTFILSYYTRDDMTDAFNYRIYNSKMTSLISEGQYTKY